jgi:hypothetical protein
VDTAANDSKIISLSLEITKLYSAQLYLNETQLSDLVISISVIGRVLGAISNRITSLEKATAKDNIVILKTEYDQLLQITKNFNIILNGSVNNSQTADNVEEGLELLKLLANFTQTFSSTGKVTMPSYGRRRIWCCSDV